MDKDEAADTNVDTTLGKSSKIKKIWEILWRLTAAIDVKNKWTKVFDI